jgi:hypothetical protein
LNEVKPKNVSMTNTVHENQICFVRFIARVTQIEGVDVALAAIADDCDLLAFYQVQIGC